MVIFWENIQNCIDYCDDIENGSSDVQDLIRFEEVMTKFEATSGTKLSRNEKSKVLGIGAWKDKED